MAGWLFPGYWSFRAMVINEFDGLTFECDPSTSVCITDGSQVPDIYTGSGPDIIGCILILVAQSLVYLVLVFAVMCVRLR